MMEPSDFTLLAQKTGLLSKIKKAGAVGNTAVLIGDSITQMNYAVYTVTSISRTAGVATVTLSGAAPLFVGCPIQIWDVQAELAGPAIITGTGGPANSWTFASSGPDIPVGALASFPRLTDLAIYADTGYFTWGNILSMQKFDLVGISANTGRYTGEMLARIGEVTGLGAAHAFICGGANDVGLASGISVAQIIANLKAICQICVAAGMTAWLSTILPIGASIYNAAVMARIMAVNAAMRRFAKTTRGVCLIDAFAALTDPTAANKGQAKAGVLQADGLHPTRLGGYLWGKALKAATASVPMCDERTMSPADCVAFDPSSNNILDYAPWVPSGGLAPTGGATGTIPLGRTGARVGAGVVVFDAPARADGFGYDQRATCTSSAAGDGFTCGGGGYSWHGRLSGTPIIQSDVTVSTAGLNGSGCYAIQHTLVLVINGVSQRYISALSSTGSTDAESIKEDWVGVLRTPPVRLTMLPTNAYDLNRADCSVAGSQFSVAWGRGAIRVYP